MAGRIARPRRARKSGACNDGAARALIFDDDARRRDAPMKFFKTSAAFLLALALTACAGAPRRPPLPVAERVDLARFMGPWRVIAAIPVSIEKNAYDAVETYALDPDGTIATTYAFREGSFEGKPRRFTPRGFVVDRVNNSTWGMRFVWPFKAEYLISYLDESYSVTIIARNKRDYAWIMAREPSIPDVEYERLKAMLADWGYDLTRLRKFPQPVR